MSRGALRRIMVAALMLGGAAGCGREPVDPAYVAEVDAWHEGRIARLTDETGWLTLVGLHPLPEGVSLQIAPTLREGLAVYRVPEVYLYGMLTLPQ